MAASSEPEQEQLCFHFASGRHRLRSRPFARKGLGPLTGRSTFFLGDAKVVIRFRDLAANWRCSLQRLCCRVQGSATPRDSDGERLDLPVVDPSSDTIEIEVHPWSEQHTGRSVGLYAGVC